VIRGLMTAEEWAIFARFLTTPSSQGGRPPQDHRKVLDGVFWIGRTGAGAPWRDLPDALDN
jgi:transposase